MNYKKLLDDIYNIRIPIIIIIIYILLTNYFFHAVCPSIILFHHECPACGLTRACFYFLTFRFKKSFNYNPSVIFWMILIVIGFISRYIKKIPDKYLYGLSIIVSLISLIIYIKKSL